MTQQQWKEWLGQVIKLSDAELRLKIEEKERELGISPTQKQPTGFSFQSSRDLDYDDWLDSVEEDDPRIDWELEGAERREEELAQRASECVCGAWQFSKKTGAAIKVADCCCGAE